MSFFLLYLALFVSFLQRVVSSEIFLNSSDPYLVFLPGWITRQSDVTGGTFLSTDTLGSVLNVTLPVGTSFVNYIAFQRQHGSVYGVAVDGADVLGVFDGHDPTLVDDADALPISIWTLSVDPTQDHVLTIYNFPDLRFANTSELTFDTLIITVDDGQASDPSGQVESTTTAVQPQTVDPSPTIYSSILATTLPADVPGVPRLETATSTPPSASFFPPTSVPSSAPISKSTSSAKGVSNSLFAVLIGLVVFAFLFLIIGLVLYFRSRRRRQALMKSPLPDVESNNNPPMQTRAVPSGALQVPPPTLQRPQSSVISEPPQRPQNPFADTVPPDVSLEGPYDSVYNTVMQQRMRQSINASPVSATFKQPWVTRRLNPPATP